MKTTRLLIAIACAAALTACGGGAATGSGVDTEAKGGPGNLFASKSAKASPKATVAKPKPRASAPRAVAPVPKRTTSKPAPRQKPAEAPPFRITINGDKSGKALIDPPQAAVFSGTKVIWTNADSKPHGVQAKNGAFNSGPIPPGGSYTWVAGAAGQYAYQDSSRPYVNAEVQVSPT